MAVGETIKFQISGVTKVVRGGGEVQPRCGCVGVLSSVSEFLVGSM